MSRKDAVVGTGQRLRRAGLRATLALVMLGASATVAACGSSGGSGTASADSTKPLKVGIVELAQLGLFDQMVDRFEADLRQSLAPRKVEFQVKNAQGDASLVQSIAADMASSSNDMFAIIGTDAIIALNKSERRRPIIGIAVSDPVGAKLAQSLQRPGGNVTGSTDFVAPSLVLDQLVRTSPVPKRLGTIINPGAENDQVWIKLLRQAVKQHGLSLVEASISGSSDIPTAARSLVGRVDAILLPPDAVVVAGAPAVGAVATSNKLPLYLTGGDSSVKGVLALLGPDYMKVATLAAQDAAKVAKGASPAATPFLQPGSAAQWSVNKQTLKSLTVKLPAGTAG